MKKNLLSTWIVCIATAASAQPCTTFEGLGPVQVKFGINAYGQPESSLPLVPLYWNRFYKANETTGQIEPLTCAYTGDPNLHQFAYCACFLNGFYFRKVTPSCDPTACGSDIDLPVLPKTDNSSGSSSWSQGSTWVGGLVPDISSSPAVMVTKSALIDADITLFPGHGLLFSGGNSSIPAGKTVTCNAVMQISQAAQLENFGIINGTGQILGSLINSGTLSPGNSPGKFTIVGNYTATGTAVHTIEIGAANLYDTLSIVRDSSFPGGNAVLNGTLNVSLLNGFVPASGDGYKIITYHSVTGAFTSINLPNLPGGLIWSVNYNLSDITLQVNAALPVTMLYVRAYKQNNGVQIEWGTEKEINVKNYEVQRSSDGIYFIAAGMINAGGLIANNYSLFDAAPEKGNNYYRVKAIDLDGKFKYSSTLLVNVARSLTVNVYPNPAKRGASLQLNLQNNTAGKIEIMNAVGQVLYSKTGNITGRVSIPVSPLWPAGQYLLRITGGNRAELQKIVIQ